MTNLKELLVSRLSRFDSTLDLTEGSTLMTTVVDPVVSIFGGNLLDEDTRVFLINKVEEAFPDAHVTPGDALYDVLISGMSLFLGAYKNELDRVANAQSINNIDTLSDADVDDLAANWLMSRNTGSLASCRVRIIFNLPTSIRIDTNVIFYTADGITFRPDGTYNVSAGAMRNNELSEDEFFLDISAVSTEPGSNSNIPVGAIIGVSGLEVTASVSNISQGVGGLDRESNENLLLARLPQAVSERSLVTPRGIRARLMSSFSSLLRIAVIGFGDTEMVRDLAESEGEGPLITSGFAFIHARSQRAILCHYNVADLSNKDYIVASIPSLTGSSGEVEARLRIRISSVDRSNSASSILPRTLTSMCSLEGPIDIADSGWIACIMTAHKDDRLIINGEGVTRSDHLGGNTDVYVHPDDDVIGEALIPVSTSNHLVTGVGVGSTVGSNLVSLRLSPDTNKFNLAKSSVLKITGSDQLHTFTLAATDSDVARLHTDYPLEQTLSIETSIRWYLYESLEIDISSGRERILPLREEDLTCSGLLGTNTLVLNSSVSIPTLGLNTELETYYVSIDIDGLVFISNITSISSNEATLASPLRSTVHNASCEILKAKEAIALPLSHIQRVSAPYGNLSYGRSYGSRVINLGGARTKQRGMLGIVAPKYDGLFSRLLAPILSSLDMDYDSYLTSMSSDYANTVGNALPFSYGIADPISGAGVVRYKHVVEGNQIYGEAAFPLELFMPGPYNIFIAHGNLKYEDVLDYISNGSNSFPSTDSYPISCSRGDTFTISSGANAGEYVIDQVYDIEIKLASPYIEDDIETYQGDREDLAGISGDPNFVVREVNSSKLLKFTIIKVDSPFASCASSIYESEMRLQTTPNEISPSDNVIQLSDLISMLMKPSNLVSSELIDESPLRDTAQERLGMEVLRDLYEVNAIDEYNDLEVYETGSPAQGELRVYFEGNGPIRIPAPSTSSVSHSAVNAHLFNASSGESSDPIEHKRSFIAERDGLSLCLSLERYSPALIYSDTETTYNDPLTWRRDLDISRVDVDSPEGMHIPSNILLNGRSPLPLSQDETRIGLDLVELPSEYAYPVSELSLNMQEELLIHKEAPFPEYEIRSAVSVTPRFSILPSTTPLTFEFEGQSLTPVAVVRKGNVYIEPSTINVGYTPPWWLGSSTPEDLAVILESSREAISTLSYIRLNDIASLEDFLYLNTFAPEGIDALSALNIYGRTLLEEINLALERDPRAIVLIHTDEQVIQSVPSDISSYIIHPNSLQLLSASILNASDADSGMLVGTTVMGSNALVLHSPYNEIGSMGLNQSHVGALLHIDSGEDEGGYTIQSIDADTGTIFVDRPLTSSTASISAKGIIGIKTEDAKVLYMGLASVQQTLDDGDFIPRASLVSPEYTVGSSLVGNSTRLLTEADVGKYITLHSLVRRPDSDIYAENTLFTPVRRHIGVYEIRQVLRTTSTDASTGDVVHLASEITLESEVDLSDLGEFVREYEEVFFMLTEDPVPPQDEFDLKCAVDIHVYETEAIPYKIIGYQPDVSKESARQLVISTLGYDVPSSINRISPFVVYEPIFESDNRINISMDRNNPYAIIRTDESLFYPQGKELGLSFTDIPIQSKGHRSAYNSIGDESFSTTGEVLDGYSVSSSRSDDAFTVDERVTIQLPARLRSSHRGKIEAQRRIASNSEISIEYVHSPTVRSVQSLLSAGDERVVCSDIRAKRMMPAYVGVELSFLGVLSTYDISEAIRVQLKNNVLAGSPISSSNLISTAFSKGVTNVSTSILYYCSVDRNRDRRLEIVTGELSQSSLVVYDGTVRITGLFPATANSQSLNAAIRVTKSAATTRIGRGV